MPRNGDFAIQSHRIARVKADLRIPSSFDTLAKVMVAIRFAM
jgi:hypothetical protein